MCGIAGFNFQNKDLIKQMTDSIAHRGPDGEGFYIDDHVSLGHRRLSIIDLSEKGSQPMIYKNYIITFNGEIYNFLDIKNELSSLGHAFISNSDTEVILHAYEQWGKQCLDKFNGMWAFCIYDKTNKTFFISRDRFGKKPLYYYHNKSVFIFSSELKAIRQAKIDLTISLDAINYYFYQKYIGNSFSIYNEINKLEPGCNLIYEIESGTVNIEKYYHLEKEINKFRDTSVKSRLDLITSLIPDCVEKRLISDVPVGSFLSGGLDSSLISAIISKNKKDFNTFSIGFNEKTFDELPYSQQVAKNIKTNHHYQILSIDEDLILSVLSRLDEPFGDPSLIPTYLLAKITREKVTVCLSGDAGDELFGGYDTYKAFKISNFIPDFIFKSGKYFFKGLSNSDKNLSFMFRLSKFVRDYDKNPIIRHLNWMSQISNYDHKQLLGNNFIQPEKYFNFTNQNGLLSIQLSDVNNYMVEDILKKVDAASMMNSLEVRVPFLDYRLVPVVLSLPDEFKIRFFKTKSFLKKYANTYLPGNIVNRKKQGFAVPISNWISESKVIKEFILNSNYYNHNLINFDVSNKFLHHHLNKIADFSRPLWLIFILNYWYYKNHNFNNYN